MNRPQWLLDLSELHLLALCIWSEARGEGSLGKLAVANVVMNRVARPSWWGNSIQSVILKPWQFSWFNAPAAPVTVDPISLTVAELVMGGATRDNTLGSTHFHATYVAPNWVNTMSFKCQIGRHLFYKEG